MQRGREYCIVPVMRCVDGSSNLHPICAVPESKGPVG